MVENKTMENNEEKRKDKLRNFYKKNKIMINSIAGTSLVMLSVSAVVINNLIKENSQLLDENNILSADNFKLKMDINELQELCEAKDNYVKKLASDALRKGSRIGGQTLRDARTYMEQMRQ